MKKLLVALPVVAGAAWAGSSYFAGTQTESVYDQLLSQAEMKPFTFEKESFEKGLTTSQAVTIVRESSSPDAPIVLRLQHEINHSSVQMDEAGPAVGTATIRTTLVKDSVNPKYEAMRDYFQGDEPLEIITKAGISGNVNNRITVSASEFPVKDGTETLSIAESVITVSTDSERSVGEGSIGALTLNDVDGNSITSTPSQLSFNLANRNPWAAQYEILFNTDVLTLESPDLDTPARITDFKVSTDSTPDNDEIDYTTTIDIGEIDLGSLIFTASSPISSGTLNVAVNNVKVQALEEFNAYFKQYAAAESEAPSSELGSEIFQQYAKLATKNVELIYDLALENSEGKANADILLRFIGDDSETGRDNIATGADLGNALEVDVNVVADKDALEITPAILMIGTPAGQIAFVEQGDQYVAKATIRKLVADLNGQIFPLAELSGGMLEIPLEELLQMGGPF